VLAGEDFTIVSGLARGIDTAAHKAALRRGRTLAILGSGLSHIYPRENEGLAQAIAEKGALISIFPPTTPPDRHLFPKRNSVISAFSKATLIIEAPREKSGAMITARYAIEQSRPLFALPGRVDNETFSGNHELIKKQQAQLVETPEEILSFFGELFSSQPARREAKASLEKKIALLSSQEKQILAVLQREEASVETLSRVVAIPAELLHATLMDLILKKMIKELPGKIYQSCIHG
jgi:DNA processing protein